MLQAIPPLPRAGATLGSLALLVGLAGAGAGGAEPAMEPRPWYGGELRITAGLDFRSGDYGEAERTDFLYAPLTLTYELAALPLTPAPHDTIELSLTLPGLAIRGPGDVVGSSDAPLLVGGGTPGRRTERGLGDLVLRGSYLWFPSSGSGLPGVELTGKVKLPTADERRGLGTGEIDTTAQVDLYRSFGRWTPFVSLGRRFMGDAPDLRLDDAWLASTGVMARVTTRLRAGLIYDWIEAVSPGARDGHELFPYVVFRWRPRILVIPYGVIGLSEGSPDYGLGLQLRWSLPVG